MKLVRYSLGSENTVFALVIGDHAVSLATLQLRSGITRPDVRDSKAYLAALPESEQVVRELLAWGEAHLAEQSVQFLRVGMGEFDEFKTVGASGVGGADLGFRGVMRKWAHGLLLFGWRHYDAGAAHEVCIPPANSQNAASFMYHWDGYE